MSSSRVCREHVVGAVTCARLLVADANECVLETDNCDASANCLNNEGSFTCTCDPGFRLQPDGLSCLSKFASRCQALSLFGACTFVTECLHEHGTAL